MTEGQVAGELKEPRGDVEQASSEKSLYSFTIKIFG